MSFRMRETNQKSKLKVGNSKSKKDVDYPERILCERLMTIRVVRNADDVLNRTVSSRMLSRCIYDPASLFQNLESTSAVDFSSQSPGSSEELLSPRYQRYTSGSPPLSFREDSFPTGSLETFRSGVATSRIKIKRKFFFREIFKGRTPFCNWSETDVSQARDDIKLLNLSQLKFLWDSSTNVAKLGWTAGMSGSSSMSRMHIEFADTVRNTFYGKFLQLMIYNKSIEALIRHPDIPPRDILSPSVSPLILSPSCQLSSHPFFGPSWFQSLSEAEKSALGRELLLVIGLGLRLMSGTLSSRIDIVKREVTLPSVGSSSKDKNFLIIRGASSPMGMSPQHDEESIYEPKELISLRNPPRIKSAPEGGARPGKSFLSAQCEEEFAQSRICESRDRQCPKPADKDKDKDKQKNCRQDNESPNHGESLRLLHSNGFYSDCEERDLVGKTNNVVISPDAATVRAAPAAYWTEGSFNNDAENVPPAAVQTRKEFMKSILPSLGGIWWRVFVKTNEDRNKFPRSLDPKFRHSCTSLSNRRQSSSANAFDNNGESFCSPNCTKVPPLKLQLGSQKVENKINDKSFLTLRTINKSSFTDRQPQNLSMAKEVLDPARDDGSDSGNVLGKENSAEFLVLARNALKPSRGAKTHRLSKVNDGVKDYDYHAPAITSRHCRSSTTTIARQKPKQGPWKRVLSQAPLGSPPEPGFELYVHIPTLVVDWKRPRGVPIFSYCCSAPPAGTSGQFRTEDADGGHEWDIVRFHKDSLSLSTAHLSGSAYDKLVSELTETLKLMRKEESLGDDQEDDKGYQDNSFEMNACMQIEKEDSDLPFRFDESTRDTSEESMPVASSIQQTVQNEAEYKNEVQNIPADLQHESMIKIPLKKASLPMVTNLCMNNTTMLPGTNDNSRQQSYCPKDNGFFTARSQAADEGNNSSTDTPIRCSNINSLWRMSPPRVKINKLVKVQESTNGQESTNENNKTVTGKYSHKTEDKEKNFPVAEVFLSPKEVPLSSPIRINEPKNDSNMSKSSPVIPLGLSLAPRPLKPFPTRKGLQTQTGPKMPNTSSNTVQSKNPAPTPTRASPSTSHLERQSWMFAGGVFGGRLNVNQIQRSSPTPEHDIHHNNNNKRNKNKMDLDMYMNSQNGFSSSPFRSCEREPTTLTTFPPIHKLRKYELNKIQQTRNQSRAQPVRQPGNDQFMTSSPPRISLQLSSPNSFAQSHPVSGSCLPSRIPFPNTSFPSRNPFISSNSRSSHRDLNRVSFPKSPELNFRAANKESVTVTNKGTEVKMRRQHVSVMSTPCETVEHSKIYGNGNKGEYLSRIKNQEMKPDDINNSLKKNKIVKSSLERSNNQMVLNSPKFQSESTSQNWIKKRMSRTESQSMKVYDNIDSKLKGNSSKMFSSNQAVQIGSQLVPGSSRLKVETLENAKRETEFRRRNALQSINLFSHRDKSKKIYPEEFLSPSTSRQ